MGFRETDQEKTRMLSAAEKFGGEKEFKKYGRYEILKEIGKGSMGMVYLARDPHIDRLVALKVLRPDRVSSEEFMKRFLREAKAIGKLSHPNIVAVYDVGEDHGTAFIAEEYLDGVSLEQAIEERRLPPRDIVAIGLSIAETLEYAHRKGIVHRDIKPSNIIISPDKQVKLTDFSIAHIEDPEATVQTQTGEILGTPAYMSPEQVLGQAVDGRSDIFSLGVVLYELATGERPFKGSNLTAIFRAITTVNPAEIGKIKPPVPRRLELIIMKSLAKAPEERYSNGLEMAEALRSCCGEIKRPKTTLPTTPREKITKGSAADAGKHARIPMPVLLALAVIVAVGLGGAAYEVFHLPKPRVTASLPAQPSSPQPLPKRTVSHRKLSVSPSARSPGAESSTSNRSPVKENGAPPGNHFQAASQTGSSPPIPPAEALQTRTAPPARGNTSSLAGLTPEPKIAPSPPSSTAPTHSNAEVTQKPPPPTSQEPLPSLRKKPVSPPVASQQGGNPPSALEGEKSKQVGELLVEADAAYERGDILTLGGTSAARYFKDVFAIDGNQTDAFKGMMRVIRKYLQWAGKGNYKGKDYQKHFLSMAKECLNVIPEGLKRAHASEIESVNREIKSLSSRRDFHETVAQEALVRRNRLGGAWDAGSK